MNIVERYLAWLSTTLQSPANQILFLIGGVALLCLLDFVLLPFLNPSRRRGEVMLRRFRPLELAHGDGRPAPLREPAARSTTAPRATRQAAAPAPAPRALALDEWWYEIGDTPVSVMLVGNSQSGKTTTAKALLAWRAQYDDIVIIDPHASLNDWGSLQPHVIGHGRDFAACAAAVTQLHQEFIDRYQPGADISRGITVFIDEYNALIAARPELTEYFTAWFQEAAKVGMRLVVLPQDDSVEGLGLKGRGKVRMNLRKVLLGEFTNGVSGVLRFPIAIEISGARIPVDGHELPELATEANSIHAAAIWPIEIEAEAEPAEPVRAVRAVRETPDPLMFELIRRTGSPQPTPVLAYTDAENVGSEPMSDAEIIKFLATQRLPNGKYRWSATAIYEFMGGTKQDRLAEIAKYRPDVPKGGRSLPKTLNTSHG